MRTQFGKSFIASGMIAALGLNLTVTSTALAGPGRDRDDDRSYQRDRGDKRGNAQRNDAQRNNVQQRNDGRGPNQAAARAAPAQPQQAPARNRQTVNWRAPAKAEHQRPAVKIVQKPVVVNKTVVVKQPPANRRPAVVHQNAVHAAPVVRVNYGDRGGRDRHDGDAGRSYGHSYGPQPTRVIVVPERRRYRDIWVVRSYGHRYHGYGHYVRDNDAYKWLAFTAISVALINNLSVYQQRAYEDAQIRATTAPIGETIQWQDAGAYGSVTTTRDGTSSQNRYCREFQKTVTIGGQTEQAYGTACMQPDGAWEVISDNS
jgi:hypothetical protein